MVTQILQPKLSTPSAKHFSKHELWMEEMEFKPLSDHKQLQ